MRIGIVCYPPFGGSGVVATELGMALADNGHEVHFITYNQPVRLDFISHNLHFHEVMMEEYPLFQYQPYELALSTRMVEVVERYKLEVLHVHYAIPHAYAAYMAKQMLKEKVIRLASNEGLRVEFSQNLKKYLDEVVSWEVVVKKYKEAYKLARLKKIKSIDINLPHDF